MKSFWKWLLTRISGNLNSYICGSTCVSMIYTPERLICGNVGDSRCILGRHVNNDWKYHCMSRDHKPTDRDEEERILNKNGRIAQYQGKFSNKISL